MHELIIKYTDATEYLIDEDFNNHGRIDLTTGYGNVLTTHRGKFDKFNLFQFCGLSAKYEGMHDCLPHYKNLFTLGYGLDEPTYGCD